MDNSMSFPLSPVYIHTTSHTYVNLDSSAFLRSEMCIGNHLISLFSPRTFVCVCKCILPFFDRQVKVCVDVQQDFFEEAQPVTLSLLGEVKHLLHVLHVARVTAVQLLQGLCVALLRLPHTQNGN